MNTQQSLKCLRCVHRDVCKLNTPSTCNSFIPDKNPELLKQALDIAHYRAEMKKAARGIQGVTNFFTNASAAIEEQIARLEKQDYPAVKLTKIVEAVRVIQRKLVEEATAIEQKSKFPPQ